MTISIVLKIALEIAIFWWVIYAVLLFIKGTRAAQLLKGVIIVILLFFIVQHLGLSAVSYILAKILAISVIGFLIIFQPEIRRGLARIGQFGIFTAKERIVDEIVKAAAWLSERKIGAIIAIEREVGLGSYIESGVQIDSRINTDLLTTIFMPNTPLHDGGVIIQLDRVTAAGCLFPLAQDAPLTRKLGTRHRAAIGLTEETDAVVVVISEETGAISVVVGGSLTSDLSKETLSRLLTNLLYRQKHNETVHN
ncbi:MAG: diadenylate cyclase CdaA [Candidatus Omnitrophica bacterium]|nr:diadenylate cyclase CdaA [Candidatus Omnitrophota bacterium]